MYKRKGLKGSRVKIKIIITKVFSLVFPLPLFLTLNQAKQAKADHPHLMSVYSTGPSILYSVLMSFYFVYMAYCTCDAWTSFLLVEN